MMKRFSSSWIRVVEHWVLRVASLVCSLFSAYAIHLFFVPLEVVDHNEQILTWGVAAAFGCLGYIVSRGLVHRLMNKERIWAYVPVVFLVVLVDMACNYILAASAVRSDQWLAAVPQGQQGVLTFITYLILSVIPLMSIVLAVVDMDLERSKGGGGAVGARVGGAGGGAHSGAACLAPDRSATARGGALVWGRIRWSLWARCRCRGQTGSVLVEPSDAAGRF